MPQLWFEIFSAIALGVALICCTYLIVAVVRHPQQMAVMNWVWPITALYFGPVAVFAYNKLGREASLSMQRSMQISMHETEQGMARDEAQSETPSATREMVGSGVGESNQRPHQESAGTTAHGGSAVERVGEHQGEHQMHGPRHPFWQTVWVEATHCGAGCTLGDLIAEWVIFLVAVKIAGMDYWPEMLLNFVLAYLLGIVFQYFAIAPMRGISGWPGIWAAIKADTLSLSAFEIGLLAWMALFMFVIFPAISVNNPAYWFMMQIGMVIGFGTSYPMNWWLVRQGIKVPM